MLALYRVRWQVEVLIKRFKSVLALDQLRTKDPELAQVYLLGKGLAVVLMDEWADQQVHAVRAWFDDPTRPVSLWRWTTFWWEQLRALVRGAITLLMIHTALPKLSRYLCDSPRRRPSQLACTRHWLQRLAPVLPALSPVHA